MLTRIDNVPHFKRIYTKISIFSTIRLRKKHFESEISLKGVECHFLHNSHRTGQFPPSKPREKNRKALFLGKIQYIERKPIPKTEKTRGKRAIFSGHTGGQKGKSSFPASLHKIHRVKTQMPEKPPGIQEKYSFYQNFQGIR